MQTQRTSHTSAREGTLKDVGIHTYTSSNSEYDEYLGLCGAMTDQDKSRLARKIE